MKKIRPENLREVNLREIQTIVDTISRALNEIYKELERLQKEKQDK